jgi:hypothetical protein
MSWFRKKVFDPNLMDLHDYEGSLLLSRDKYGTKLLQPISMIPDRHDRDWTAPEMEAMQRNRRLAQAIHDRIQSGY